MSGEFNCEPRLFPHVLSTLGRRPRLCPGPTHKALVPVYLCLEGLPCRKLWK